jgi:hypothetical protein
MLRPLNRKTVIEAQTVRKTARERAAQKLLLAVLVALRLIDPMRTKEPSPMVLPSPAWTVPLLMGEAAPDRIAGWITQRADSTAAERASRRSVEARLRAPP